MLEHEVERGISLKDDEYSFRATPLCWAHDNACKLMKGAIPTMVLCIGMHMRDREHAHGVAVYYWPQALCS